MHGGKCLNSMRHMFAYNSRFVLVCIGPTLSKNLSCKTSNINAKETPMTLTTCLCKYRDPSGTMRGTPGVHAIVFRQP